MNSFDKDLVDALNADDRAFLEDLENGRGLFAQLGATMQGPLRFWSYLLTVITFILFVFAVYCGWQALQATELRETVLWAIGFLTLFQGVSFMKMWLFDRMNLLSILGELKRIELRVAQLAERD